MVVGELPEAVDLVVVGGGPGGYVAALRAAQLGRAVTLVDDAGPDRLGGVCLQVGCIPSKALIELADTAHRTSTFGPAGLRVSGVEVSLEDFQRWRTELCTGLDRGVAGLLERGGVRVLHGRARFNRPDRIAVHTPQDVVQFLEPAQVILATGSRATELPGLPFDGDRVLDSTGALALTAVPRSVAVVGAGYIGVELGTALAKLGARVTLVEALDHVLPAMEPTLTAPIARRLAALGVDVRLNTMVEGLKDDALVVRGPDGEERIDAEKVIVAVGRTPNTDDLGLDRAGVDVAPDGLIAVRADRRVTDRIAAVGDIVPGPALAHKASAEAIVAAEALSGRPAAFDPAVIPAVVFADPELATVGLTAAEARRQGMDVRVASFPLAASGRAGTLRERDGFTQIVADATTDRVVGVHLVGPHVSELAAGAALAVEMLASPADVAGTIHPHPTISEGLSEAAELLLGHPIHVTL